MKVINLLTQVTSTDIDGRLDDVVYGHEHHVLDLQQPLLNGTARVRRRDLQAELHLLALTREHGQDVQLGIELELGDSLETLLEVRLYAHRVFRLRENLQHLIVRQKEEAETTNREVDSVYLYGW